MKAILGLGGNIGDSLGNIRAALHAIANLCGTRLLRVSRYYLTEAVEVNEPQPPYINCAAEIETRHRPLSWGCQHWYTADLGNLRTVVFYQDEEIGG